MSVELKVKDADRLVPGESVQGFVCFSWKSPLHKYCNQCRITMMQVTLEGYVSKSSEHLSQLTRRRCKLLSSEVVRVRAIYGLKSLGQLYGGQRSFQYPFVLSLPKNAVPSCPASGRLLSVQYRLKARLVLCDPCQRSRETHYTNYTGELDVRITGRPAWPSSSSPEVPPSPPPQVVERGAGDEAEGLTLSVDVAGGKALRPGALVQSLVTVANATGRKSLTRLQGRLLQRVQCRDTVVTKQMDVFNLKIDKDEARQRHLTFDVLFDLPDPLLPSVSLKDGQPVVAYALQVRAEVAGKKVLKYRRPFTVLPPQPN